MFNLVFSKRIGLGAASALLASLIAIVPTTTANAVLGALDSTNLAASAETVDASLITATQRATLAVIHPATAIATTGHAARSAGLVAKSTGVGTGQTATVRAGGVLSLYAQVSTSTAITADGGSFTAASTNSATVANTSSPTTNGKFFGGITTATPIAALWQAPTTAGSYTVSMFVSQAASNTVTAATAGGGLLVASIVVTVSALSHDTVSTGTNYPLLRTSPTDNHLFTAVELSTSGAGVVGDATSLLTVQSDARSIGLLVKDSTAATAQTATVLAGGALSLYAHVSTDAAFTASSGTFSGATGGSGTPSYSGTVRDVFIAATSGSTPVAVLWNAPATAGTYTVSMNTSAATNQLGASDFSGTLTGQITVTVVAASAGGSYSAAYSACNTRSNSQGHGVATGVDTTSAITNGQTAYIAFDLDDGYDAALDSGAVVVTATGGALLSLAANGTTAAAGTTSTVVSARVPSDQVVQVTQATANAPMTTTVTITFNGTTVCTKTVTIRGEIASLVVSNVGTGDINSANSITPALTTWMAATIGATDRAGLFNVTAKDSAGNNVVTNSGGTYAADSATLTTTVQALSVTNTATTVSSSADTFNGLAFGTWTCGAAAGSSAVKLTWTNSGSGKVVTSDAFTARCSDDPYTYTASLDKASYVQGEIATLTVQFLDSKGNKANTVGLHNVLATGSFPMMTAVTAFTGVVANKTDGSRVYTFTVGGTTAVTAGSYVAIVEYASLAAGTKQTPAYKISTGSTDVSNAEVLKSIVALIASINKQIQALQKLILQRR